MTGLDRYEWTGDLGELGRLIDRLTGLRGAEPDPRERLGITNDLAILLWSRYEATGDGDDLDRAIGELRGALAGMAGDDPKRQSVQTNLGGALRDRSMRTGDLADLAEGVRLMRAAAEATAPDDPAYAGRQGNLGGALLAFYQRSGHSDVLREAVRACRLAVDAAAGGDAPPGGLSNLAECLRALHHLTGDAAALDAAVDLARRAAAALPPSHVLYGRFQANLSLVLTDRHRFVAARSAADRGGAARDGLAPHGAVLDGAVLDGAGLDGAGPDGAGRDGAGPGGGVGPSGGGAGPVVPAELAEALRASRAACANTPAGHPNEPERYAGYATVLGLIYWAAPTPGVLAELRRVARTAVAVTPAAHPDRAQALSTRAMAELIHADAAGDARAMAQALDDFSAIVLGHQLPVGQRVAAAHLLARTIFITRSELTGVSPDGALAIFQLAVDLLPRVARRDLVAVDRERNVGRFADLARDAALCAIAFDRPDLALSLLEQGRGVLLAQTLETWPDLARLRAGHPELAEEFERLLATPEPVGPDPVVAAQRRAVLARRWDEVLARTRATPAFADFLRAPTGPDLLRAAAPGPLVVVNVGALRSAALIVTIGGVRVLPLPELSWAGSAAQADRLAAVVRPAPGAPRTLADLAAGERIAREVLTWLWRVVVDPVLTTLGYPARAPGEPLPRLWWIPTGALTALPLHAAGDYLAPGGGSALDRVVSSYAPTIRSLRRHRARPVPDGPPRAPLVVAVPDAPHAPPLPGAAAEARTVAARYPGARLLLGADATVEAVLDGLARHDWVHFAGHARGEPEDPGTGHLTLHDGRVTVRDLSRHPLAQADLAFLSACETTLGGTRLSEEAVHLTGACHLAGFRHVIGTLWRVPDDIAARMADDVHATLAAAPQGSAAAAAAVNLAARRVRADYPDACTLWSAHVHVGG